MPKIIVEDFGGKRCDAGMLGSAIYFASSARLEYSFWCCLFYQMIKELVNAQMTASGRIGFANLF